MQWALGLIRIKNMYCSDSKVKYYWFNIKYGVAMKIIVSHCSAGLSQ